MPRKHLPGKHFLQIPGPSNVPDRILRAMDFPTIDHRGQDFFDLSKKCLLGMKKIFKTDSHVIIYPASGTGAWEAALTNTMSTGDTVLMVETGHFASLWCKLANRLGIVTELIPTDWRRGAVADKIKERLLSDNSNQIKAVCVVHNETSTGCMSNIKEVREAIDQANHGALLMVDTISSLASSNFCHDAWGVDVTVAGSQKGLMLPPGLSFNAVSEKALEFSKSSNLPKSYWAWDDYIASNKTGAFPYTPATNLFFGLSEALDMLFDEGIEEVFKRHKIHGEATRLAVQAWGLEVLCLENKDHSNTLTAVLLPDGYDADKLREVVLQNYNMSLGNGLSKLSKKVFRIGHLGDFNDLMLVATLGGIEMALGKTNIPHQAGGTLAAMQLLKGKNTQDSL
ncbi:MAG: aminotransferase class V-fold PLP-dependent enzyme [Paracoccaceae bacterium]|nr:aminotransferase class V-fold PLP-dependent enzyme [Paracoccaceae bacterium]MDG1763760.1 aminotransferase class V-fold PLP-dependent enzyme [Paracoccaceae bacterium]MDG2429918.1 aminotransferase class V-fold PLP-dependent enzyme [Paracoccaceae bacterium]|tara:strand:- start:382 stop:1572 length:1191 start_codon:yes stop_codon:yes gene_type:complete